MGKLKGLRFKGERWKVEDVYTSVFNIRCSTFEIKVVERLECWKVGKLAALRYSIFSIRHSILEKLEGGKVGRFKGGRWKVVCTSMFDIQHSTFDIEEVEKWEGCLHFDVYYSMFDIRY